METHLKNTQQLLIELMADFLDEREPEMNIDEVYDPIPRGKSELHIRMANAAFDEYVKTIQPKPATA